jgi:alkylhydroperoxidase family enzyme
MRDHHRRSKVGVMPRINAVSPPYEPDVATQLEAMMPGGAPPILLFRTFVRNMSMAKAMQEWGGYELSSKLSLTMRDRELLIDRTCAVCGCEYEWSVHVAYFGERVGLTAEQITSLAHGGPSDPCWTENRDRLVLAAADALHDTSDIDDSLWEELRREFSDAELLDLMMLCGWYHAISFAATASRLPLEPGAPRFADVEAR